MKIEIQDKQVPLFFSRSRQKETSFSSYMQSLFDQLALKIESEGVQLTIEDKVELSKYIMLQAFEMFPNEKITLAWTGGKDSTVILWMLIEALKGTKHKLPDITFINEGHVFEEIREFVAELTKKWKLKVREVMNEDVVKLTKKIGDPVEVKKLDKRNQEEVRRVGFEGDVFPFEAESLIGNHLMKTVAMNRELERGGYTSVITGIRWDEQEARASETFFSERGDEYTPYHTRIHPILHFTERDIWDAIMKFDIPFCKLYKQGYRSLGAKGTTHKADDKPAWEQDFQKISERAGRRQDKEGAMKKLRKLGYM